MSNTGKYDDLGIYLRMQLEELLSMSDSDVLDGVDPEALRAQNLAIINGATVEAGRQRMAAAKASVAIRHSSNNIQHVSEVNIAAARAFIEKAMNDSQYTLAARSLGEMSDEDVLRIYLQLKALQSKSSEGGT